MIAKAICLIVTSLTNLACCRPPAPGKIASSKDDKIQAENPLTNVNLDHVAWITVFTTANYLLLMTLADHFSDIPAIQQLRVLKAWHVATTLLAIGSVLLRQWSYRTLGQFFTYQLKIQPGHQLVNTGPYKYLRHPSYTGLFVNLVATFWFIFYQGLWDVGVDFIARMMAYFLHHKTPVMSTIALLSSFSPHGLGAEPPGTILGISSGMWFAMMYTALTFYVTWARIVVEEEMLRKHFKTEWDTYAKTRWRLVPFVF